MGIRLIALDLDGTLLTTDKRLTKRTEEALAEAASRGIHIVPATGRSITGLARKVRDLPFVRYGITVNGAAVWDMREELCIARRAFSNGQALEIWDFPARKPMISKCGCLHITVMWRFLAVQTSRIFRRAERELNLKKGQKARRSLCIH